MTDLDLALVEAFNAQRQSSDVYRLLAKLESEAFGRGYRAAKTLQRTSVGASDEARASLEDALASSVDEESGQVAQDFRRRLLTRLGAIPPGT